MACAAEGEAAAACAAYAETEQTLADEAWDEALGIA